MRISVGFFVGLFGAAASTATAQSQKPPPTPFDRYAPTRSSKLTAINLLLDGSMSMAGYAAHADPQLRPLGDIIAIARETAAVRGAKLNPLVFGTGIAPITGDVEAWGRAAAYKATESRIDVALDTVRKSAPGTLSIMVSDLWFDNRAFTGAPAVALGQPLRAILASGRSVAVVGTRVPFSGPVYSWPGGGNYAGGKERVLLLVLVGSEGDVRDFASRLAASNSPSFAPDRMRVTVFNTPSFTRQLTAPKPAGAGVTSAGRVRERASTGQTVDLPRFTIDWSDAGRADAPGRLVGGGDRARLIPANTAATGPLTFSTRLWVWQNNKWLAYRLPPGAGWKVARLDPKTNALGCGATGKPSPTAGCFSFGPATVGQLPEGRYLLSADLGASSLSPLQPAAQWMRDWDLGERPGRPAFVRTLGLAALADILTNAADGPRADAGHLVRLDIED